MTVYENVQFAGSSIKNEGLNSLVNKTSLEKDEGNLIEKIDDILKMLNLYEIEMLMQENFQVVKNY